MEAKKRYEEWLENPYFDTKTKEFLRNCVKKDVV